MAKLVLNRIKTPDGTVLTSYYRHDYRTHKDENGKTYMVDGGLAYARRNVHEDYEDLSVYDDEPFETIRDAFHWGTRGKDGKGPLTWKPLSSLSDSHIDAVLDEGHGSKWAREFFKQELEYRKENGIYIED